MSKNTNIADLINYISVDGSGNVVLTTGGQVATQSYVTTAVSNLVNAAPSTLDTLNELATALGNDANFATTVTTSISTKLPLAGGTLTGALSGTSATFSTSISTTSLKSSAASGVNFTILTENLAGIEYYADNNGHNFYTYDTTWKSRLFIADNGNIGIGTNTTDVKTHIYNTSGRTDLRVESAGGDGAFSTIQLKGGGTNAWWTIVTNSSALNGAVDTLSFYKESGIAGVKMAIQNNGNLGIGTVSPITKQDVRLETTDGVNGSVLNSYPISSFVINASGGGQRGLQLGGPTGSISSPVFLKVFGTGQRFAIVNESNVENFTVTSAGNIGIGTSSPTSNYGFEKNLTIASANNAELQLSQTANSHFLSIGITNGFNFFQTTAGQGYVYYIGGTERMRIASTGAATFSSSVTANGIMSLGNDGTYGSTYKTLGLTGNTDGTHRIFAGTADNMYIAAATARGINFWTNGGASPKMIITSFGNVGVGTDTPRTAATGGNKTLDIKGGIYFGSTGSESTCINNDDSMIFNIDANNDNSSNFFRWATNTTQETGGNELMRLSESGLLQLNSTNSTGIRFAAGGSNLNYYEEGNWTPQLSWGSGSNYSMGGINSGRYVRVGNLVHLQFQLQWSSFSGSASSGLRVTGIPFTAGGSCRSAGAICANVSINLSSGYSWLGMTIDPGASFLYIIQNASTSGYSHDPMPNSSGIVYSLTITYSIT